MLNLILQICICQCQGNFIKHQSRSTCSSSMSVSDHNSPTTGWIEFKNSLKVIIHREKIMKGKGHRVQGEGQKNDLLIEIGLALYHN